MSTRAHIGYIENNTIHYIYCHFDGYPEHVGRILQESYTDPEKIKQLIALGDISSLGPKLAPEIGEKHDFSNPAKDVTVAYHRDRGEDWDFTKPQTTMAPEAFFRQEYNYLINLDDPNNTDYPLNKWMYGYIPHHVFNLETWHKDVWLKDNEEN